MLRDLQYIFAVTNETRSSSNCILPIELNILMGTGGGRTCHLCCRLLLGRSAGFPACPRYDTLFRILF